MSLFRFAIAALFAASTGCTDTSDVWQDVPPSGSKIIFSTDVGVPTSCSNLKMAFRRGMGSEEQRLHCTLNTQEAMRLAQRLTGSEAVEGTWPYLYRSSRDQNWWNFKRGGTFYGAMIADGKNYKRMLIVPHGQQSDIWISVGHI